MNTYSFQHEGTTLEVEIYAPEQIEELKNRVRAGNKKLNEVYDIIKKMEIGDAWVKAFYQWYLSNIKLRAYCDQLEQLGFHECLYIVEGKKVQKCDAHELGCRVCSAVHPYWKDEKAWQGLVEGSEDR